MPKLKFAKPNKRRTVRALTRRLHRVIVTDVRERVFAREPGMCRIWASEIGPFQRCLGRATDLHEIIFRSQGGRQTVENTVALCHKHHMAIHSRKIWIIGTNANGPLSFVSEKPA